MAEIPSRRSRPGSSARSSKRRVGHDASRSQIGGVSDDGEIQPIGIEQRMSDPLGLVQSHGPEERRPAVEVIDAKIFQLDLDENRGDPRTRNEGARKGAAQKASGERELGLP